MEQHKVKVLDKRNDFRELMCLDFELAASLNVGDTILPDATGFAFIVVDKLLSKDLGGESYSLRLNVVEYETKLNKLKRLLLGIKPYGYWAYYENKKLCRKKIE